MNWILKAAFSSVGSKVIVAVTGILLFLFITGHMFGNFLLFKGADPLNSYAHMLQNLGAYLWIIRTTLAGLLFLHMFFALKITWDNYRARPINYRAKKNMEASLTVRTMWITGILIFVFLSYHIMHFTLHVISAQNVVYLADKNKDVFKMVVLGFQDPITSISYIASMVFMGFHISHGLPSLCQTLGISHPKYDFFIRIGGSLAAWLIVLGDISMPLLVLTGFVNMGGI